MANIANKLRLPAFKDTQWQIMAGPVLSMLILAMMVLPLPAFLLDTLFTFNIVLSLMILMVAMFTQKTLEFSAFPTVLLFSTLLRLALNIASTRIILMEGHTGAAAAGRVVEAFGHFLVGGNFAIGIVVFVILVIINFMVITKGAGRIAEVGARFVLDGMPGKQMAIDADLNAGLIGWRCKRCGAYRGIESVGGSRYPDRYRGWDQYGGDCRRFVCDRLQPG